MHSLNGSVVARDEVAFQSGEPYNDADAKVPQQRHSAGARSQAGKFDEDNAEFPHSRSVVNRADDAQQSPQAAPVGQADGASEERVQQAYA